MLRFAESFEQYNGDISWLLSGLWSGISVPAGGSCVLSNSLARTGSYSMQMHKPNITGQVVEARFSIGAQSSTCGIGLGVYMPNLPLGSQLAGFQFRDTGNTALLSICLQSDGSICARKGDFSGTVIDISDSILTAGTFNHIETKATFDTVAGFVECRVNGVTKLQIGSLNLGAVQAASCALMLFAGTGDIFWDDIFAWDDTGTYNNSFMGAQRILTVFPVADTAQADLTIVGTSDGFAAINNVPPDGDTTYLTTATVSNKSDFALDTLPPELVAIAGVFVPAMARVDAAGIGNLKVSLVSSGDVLAGSDVPLTPSYTYYRNSFEYNPHTMAPWTKATLEAALLRIEKSL